MLYSTRWLCWSYRYRLVDRLRTGFLLALPAAAGCAATSAGSRGTSEVAPEPFAADGLTLSVRVEGVRYRGDFDGGSETFDDDDDWSFDDETETVTLPDLETAGGIALGVGWRRGASGFEIELTHTQAESDEAGSDRDVEFSHLLFNYRHYLYTSGQVQPFLLAGIGFASARIEEGADDGLVTDDADLFGVALDLGAGVAYYFHPHFALGFEASWRPNRFFYANGVDAEGDLDDPVTTGGLAVGIGLSYTF